MAMTQETSTKAGKRVAIVLSGGGARGAYEAGVLSHLIEHIYPRLAPGFEFNVFSGTSVGAIHSAYLAATAHLDPQARSQRLLETWRAMDPKRVFQLSIGDLIGIPLRVLGLGARTRPDRKEADGGVIGGLLDVAPLEQIVAERIPWSKMRSNLDGQHRVLCVSCTEVGSGTATVFLDGPLADPGPWSLDPQAHAIRTEIKPRHVRASAAIPFLFPAVRIGQAYYLDGGLRMNTPLSPALRLRADKVLVIGLKRSNPARRAPASGSQKAITQPAFLLGKVLNALLLDQLEHELRRLEVINALLEASSKTFGPSCIDRINTAVKAQRGVAYRKVDTVVIRPSMDIGSIAADCFHGRRGRRSSTRGLFAALVTHTVTRGVPDDEADLLSYIYFDAGFTEPLIELGREDARRAEDDILNLLAD